MGRVKLIRFLLVPAITSVAILGIDFWRSMGIIPDLSRAEWKFSATPDVELNAVAAAPLTLTADQQADLEKMLQCNWQKMTDTLGCTTLVGHRIETDSAPIKQRNYPVSPVMQKHISAEVDKMLADGVIEPSQSPWSSPVLLIPKKDGSYRFCVDYRKLNAVTKKDAYPLPLVSSILDRLRGAKYLSSMDIKSAYWQIPMEPESREYTAFSVPGKGLFHFKRLPFGLTNAPATWQRLIDRVLHEDLQPHVFVYLDDIIVVSEDFQQHLQLIEKIFDRLRAAGLTLSRDKCQFCRPELRYLGYVVDQQGLHVDPEKVAAIVNIPVPENATAVRSFLGMVSWYRRFIKDFATISAPLCELLKKNRKWSWTPECTNAFTELKECLIKAPILSCPDYSRPFVVQTDASAYGVGAVLTQELEDGEHVVCFLSRSLNKAERNYSTTERELLAVVWALEKLRPYVEGTRFEVITDHYSLVWLNNLKDPSGRLCRWAVKLQQHDFTIRHRKGRDHAVPDCLSRTVPIIDAVDVLDEPQAIRDHWYLGMIDKILKRPAKYPSWRAVDGRLYKHAPSPITELAENQEAWKLVLPKEQRRDAIKAAHEPATAGHPGVAKTLYRLQHKFYWPKMRYDVAQFVKKCVTCIEHKAVQLAPPGFMGSRPRVYRPFQMVSTDLIGPLPPTTRNRHQYILVVTDYYSKFVLTFPLRAATAQSIVKHMENDVFLMYGAPQFIICDNGVQFRGHDFQDLCTRYSVKIMYNALYHPQNNPTERVNRVLKTMLSAYVRDDQRAWDVHLPQVTCAIRTLVHDVTGHTPYFINFGREQILSGSDYTDNAFAADGVVNYDREPIAITRPAGFQKLYADVRKRLDAAYARNSAHYNLRRRPAQYEVGQPVWHRNVALSNAANYFTRKLAPKYVGPFVIRRKCSSVTYELADNSGKINGIWHVKDLKPGPLEDNDDPTDNDNDPIATIMAHDLDIG